MKYSEKNNINHILRKWYHIDYSQKSPEIQIIVRWVQKFSSYWEENFWEIKSLKIDKNLIKFQKTENYRILSPALSRFLKKISIFFSSKNI